jgi:hypothetical protein
MHHAIAPSQFIRIYPEWRGAGALVVGLKHVEGGLRDQAASCSALRNMRLTVNHGYVMGFFSWQGAMHCTTMARLLR